MMYGQRKSTRTPNNIEELIFFSRDNGWRSMHNPLRRENSIHDKDCSLRPADRRDDFETNRGAVVVVANCVKGDNLTTSAMHCAEGLVHEREGRYRVAVRCFSKALTAKKIELGSDPDAATLLRHMGRALVRVRRHDDALECYREMITVMGHESPATSFRFDDAKEACEDIARIHRSRKRLDLVLGCYRDFLRVTELRLGNSSNEVASVLHEIGRVYLELESFDKAMETFEKEIRVRSVICGNQCRVHVCGRVAKLLMETGAIQRKMGLNDKALEHFDWALDILTWASFEKSSTEYGETFVRSNIKSMFLKRKLERCERMLLRTSYPFSTLCLHDFVQTANDMGNLNLVKGLNKVAVSYYESAIKLQSAESGHDHKELLKMKYNMGLALHRAGMNDEAMDLFETVLRGQNAALSADSTDVANTLNQMGNVLLVKGNFGGALSVYRKSLQIKSCKLSVNHEERLGTLANLGVALLKMGCCDKARIHFEYLLNVRKNNPGDSQAEIASILGWLALANAKMGNQRKAAYLHGKRLTIRQEMFGRSHPLVGKALVDLADVRLSCQEYQATQELCRAACKIFKGAKLAPDHPFMRELKKRIMDLDHALQRLQSRFDS